jgi:hypothetical protein
MFWINMFIRLVFWGSIVVLGLWVYNRGPEGFIEDISGLAEYWMGEYEKYSSEVKDFSEKSQIKMKAEQRRRGWR